jgi:hypothetical protein
MEDQSPSARPHRRRYRLPICAAVLVVLIVAGILVAKAVNGNHASGATGTTSVPSAAIEPTAFCNTFPALPSTKPVASNAGIPAGMALTNSGSINVTTPGTVINALSVTGSITVGANNVTIQNTRVIGTSYWGISVADGVTGTKIIHDEITTVHGGYIGIKASNATVCGSYIHKYENGITAGANMTIQANYIADMQTNQPTFDADCIELYYGGNARIWGNNLVGLTPSGSTNGVNSALNITATGVNINSVDVNGNWFTGGGYTLDTDQQQGAALTNVRITNNTWAGIAPKGTGYFGPLGIHNTNQVSVFSGNKWSDGTALNH